jgi:hypothetical protein
MATADFAVRRAENSTQRFDFSRCCNYKGKKRGSLTSQKRFGSGCGQGQVNHDRAITSETPRASHCEPPGSEPGRRDGPHSSLRAKRSGCCISLSDRAQSIESPRVKGKAAAVALAARQPLPAVHKGPCCIPQQIGPNARLRINAPRSEIEHRSLRGAPPAISCAPAVADMGPFLR